MNVSRRCEHTIAAQLNAMHSAKGEPPIRCQLPPIYIVLTRITTDSRTGYRFNTPRRIKPQHPTIHRAIECVAQRDLSAKAIGRSFESDHQEESTIALIVPIDGTLTAQTRRSLHP